MMGLLWVEDEQHILELDEVKEHWQVDTALACDIAIAKVKENKYELIIVDLILPITMGERRHLKFEVHPANEYEEKYGGLWLIRYIREELHVQTPIIVLTIVVGKDREPVERVLNGKITEYLSKYDIMPEDLCNRIGEILAK